MPGAHRDVGNPEVEKGLGSLKFFQLAEACKVIVERRFEGTVQQVFDRERHGVVGAGGLAGT